MYLTFDVGTTSVKTALFTPQGNLIYTVIKDYKLSSLHLDWYEVDPETYWQAVVSGFKEIIKKSGVSPGEIKSISGCSQGETVIFLDKNDRPLRPAIIWYDNRAKDEAEKLNDLVTQEEFYQITGLLELDTKPSATKILCVKNHEKDVFNKVDKILLVENFIVYKLTGNFVTSLSLLTSSALVDIRRKTFFNKIVGYLGIDDYLPEIVEEGSVIGRVLPSFADELGINRDVIVVKGSMDQSTGTVGTGNIKPGIITETTGSALAVAVTADEVSFNHDEKLPFQVHVLPGKYLLLPYAQTSGIVYK